MSRLMLKSVLLAIVGLSTAAAFAQRQPGTAGSASGGTAAGGTATERNRGTKDTAAKNANAKDTNTSGATTAAGRNGQAHKAKATFEVYKDKAGEYRWRLRATNTQILATAGQGYSDKRSCMNAIESVKREVADAPIEEKEAAAAKDDTAKDASASGNGTERGGASTAGATGKKSDSK